MSRPRRKENPGGFPRRKERRRASVDASRYRVILDYPGRPPQQGFIETPQPCAEGDILPGVLRSENDASYVRPFAGKILKRGAADLPYVATLVIGPTGLVPGRPFDDWPRAGV